VIRSKVKCRSLHLSPFTFHLSPFDLRTMDKTYTPEQIEQRWYDFWEEKDCFKPSGEGEPFCILLPPPNVTGTLHMGHAFQHTLMDALIRYHAHAWARHAVAGRCRSCRHRHGDGGHPPT
jgi:hypothetical protein